MQSLSDSFNKSSIDSLRRFRPLQFSIKGSRRIDDVFSFLQFPKIRYFPRIQDIIDIFQEDLIDDLIISEQESYGSVFIRALSH